jgi:hypothetical protein
LRKKAIYDEHSTIAQYLVIVESMPVARWNRPGETVEMTSERQADVESILAVFFDGFRGTSEGLIRIGIWSSDGIDIDGRTRTAKGRNTCAGDGYES